MSLLLLTLLACDDTIFGVPVGGVSDSADPTDAQGFCAVLQVFSDHCLHCHDAGGAAGGLDLETDPHAALVDQPSAYPGRTLVVSGDPAASFLLVKLEDSQGEDEGTVMPLTGVLDEASLDAVRDWITQGATEACDGGSDTGTSTEPYHPEGWAEPDQHGQAAKFQDQDCLDCHGDELTGGSADVSCDSCHPSGWRTDCTFCHGGTADTTGAPPRDISGETALDALSFSPHTTHVTASATHGAYDCQACHDPPAQALSPGHFLVSDDTPGVAEMDFGGGLSAAASWSGAGCSNLYCHGDGQGDNGSATVGQDFTSCQVCHPDGSSSRDAWEGMSGEHKKHLEGGASCATCHGSTTDADQAIVAPELHVDGTVQLAFTASMSWDGASCDGQCHGVSHQSGEHDWGR